MLITVLLLRISLEVNPHFFAHGHLCMPSGILPMACREVPRYHVVDIPCETFHALLVSDFITQSASNVVLCWFAGFNSLVEGRCWRWFKNIIFKLIIENSSLGTRRKIATKWMPQTSLMRSQLWFRQWLGAAMQQAIIRGNVDQNIFHHTALLDHTRLTKL